MADDSAITWTFTWDIDVAQATEEQRDRLVEWASGVAAAETRETMVAMWDGTWIPNEIGNASGADLTPWRPAISHHVSEVLDREWHELASYDEAIGSVIVLIHLDPDQLVHIVREVGHFVESILPPDFGRDLVGKVVDGAVLFGMKSTWDMVRKTMRHRHGVPPPDPSTGIRKLRMQRPDGSEKDYSSPSRRRRSKRRRGKPKRPNKAW